jgi:hypothetical protein
MNIYKRNLYYERVEGAKETNSKIFYNDVLRDSVFLRSKKSNFLPVIKAYIISDGMDILTFKNEEGSYSIYFLHPISSEGLLKRCCRDSITSNNISSIRSDIIIEMNNSPMQSRNISIIDSCSAYETSSSILIPKTVRIYSNSAVKITSNKYAELKMVSWFDILSNGIEYYKGKLDDVSLYLIHQMTKMELLMPINEDFFN